MAPNSNVIPCDLVDVEVIRHDDVKSKVEWEKEENGRDGRYFELESVLGELESVLSELEIFAELETKIYNNSLQNFWVSSKILLS